MTTNSKKPKRAKRTTNEAISAAFRGAFEAHPQRRSDPALAVDSARETASKLVPDGVHGAFDCESLTFTAEEPPAMDIVYRSSLDWGCEHTDADAAAFCSAVANAIQAFYPHATVQVEEHLGDSRAYVTMSDGSDEGLENVEQIVKEIAERVWDDNDFWPKARRAAKVRR